MHKYTLPAAALSAALGCATPSYAASDQAVAQIRDEIKQLKESYEARIQALENRLQESEAKSATPQTEASSSTPSVPAAPASTLYNPEISLILGGTYNYLTQDPEKYRIQGFVPSGDEIGPGKRSFNLGESELTLSANVDPRFSGKLTFALSSDNKASVEEAFFSAKELSNGLNLQGGRFLSSAGYLNSQHAHVWDFVDAPLVYQTMFGGQYKTDGLQLKWLAPLDRFVEFGLEAGNGSAFPGDEHNKNGVGAIAAIAHLGDDIGDSASWRAGVSYLQTSAANRSYNDVDHTGAEVSNAFDGKSRLWIVDGVYKWAPNGNASNTNFKLQGEYLWRKENGTLTYDSKGVSLGTSPLAYSSAQSGWYLQGVYQFSPGWRAGLRYDSLDSGDPNLGLGGSALTADDFPRLVSFHPTRSSLMFDYSPSEFSRFRLQLAQDKSRPQVTDNQIFLQYVMSLGKHGAHAF